jgi:hypothetical protein
VLVMARDMGFLAMFHAEAFQKTEIDDVDLQYAIDQVAAKCQVHSMELKEIGPEKKFEVWCS